MSSLKAKTKSAVNLQKHRRYTVYFKSLSQGTEKMSTDFSIFLRFQIDANKTKFFCFKLIILMSTHALTTFRSLCSMNYYV